jgi:hypothetical protein
MLSQVRAKRLDVVRRSPPVVEPESHSRSTDALERRHRRGHDDGERPLPSLAQGETVPDNEIFPPVEIGRVLSTSIENFLSRTKSAPVTLGVGQRGR